MKKTSLFIFSLLCTAGLLWHSEMQTISPQTKSATERRKARRKKASQPMVSFIYTNEDVVNIINTLAEQKGINVLLPQGANALNVKVTIALPNPLSLEQAWELLGTILDLSGYSLFEKDGMFAVAKNTPIVGKEALQVFINVPPAQLPDSQERIRYLYYFSNLKVPEVGAENELSAILKELLTDTSVYKFDPQTNALVLVDKVNTIKSLMNILLELDKEGFKEVLDIIKLRHTTASVVADLFKKNILGIVQDERTLTAQRKQTDATYFSRAVKILAEDGTNSLILLGKPQAVSRIKEFIYTYIDIELDSGQSILHTYQLQYLDAASFADVLNKIVQSSKSGAVDQSRAVGASPAGPERYFDGVIIKADKSGDDTAPFGDSGTPKYFGSNKLIVAARNEDWRRIKALIEELDTPFAQVIIEVLIADLQVDDNSLLGSLFRNPKDLSLPSAMQFQAAHIDQVISDQTTGGKGLAEDLLKTGYTTGIATSLAAQKTPGSAIISFKDPKSDSIYNVLQVLQLNSNTKILSNPHTIAINNQQATVTIGETRLVAGAAAGSSGGAVTANKEEVTAELRVLITPRISASDTINLQVDIKVNEFIDPASDDNANQLVRRVVTNANVRTGDILALGGLIKVNTEYDLTETPILAKIPILGWFFKKKRGSLTKNNLTVFISPTIIQPRLRGGISDYTKDYLNLAKNYVNEGMLFDTLKDPITRWYFKSGADAKEVLDIFMDKDESLRTELEKDSAPSAHKEKLKVLAASVKNPSQANSENNATPSAVSDTSEQQKAELKKLVAHLDNPLLATVEQRSS